jgi:tetratricopeptide (TPR) repeat protein
MFIIFGCTSAEEKCAMLGEEIKYLYNDFIDETSSFTESQILTQCDQAIEKCPNLAIAYEMKGLVQWENDNLKEALKNYKKAVELEPQNADILSDARQLAFNADGSYIDVDENGRITSTPFQKITLEEYAQCSDSVRMEWCEYILSSRPENKQTTVLVDQNGDEIETMEFGMQYQMESVTELDRQLLRRADAEPESILHKATFLISMNGAGYGRID